MQTPKKYHDGDETSYTRPKRIIRKKNERCHLLHSDLLMKATATKRPQAAGDRRLQRGQKHTRRKNAPKKRDGSSSDTPTPCASDVGATPSVGGGGGRFKRPKTPKEIRRLAPTRAPRKKNNSAQSRPRVKTPVKKGRLDSLGAGARATDASGGGNVRGQKQTHQPSPTTILIPRSLVREYYPSLVTPAGGRKRGASSIVLRYADTLDSTDTTAATNIPVEEPEPTATEVVDNNPFRPVTFAGLPWSYMTQEFRSAIPVGPPSADLGRDLNRWLGRWDIQRIHKAAQRHYFYNAIEAAGLLGVVGKDAGTRGKGKKKPTSNTSGTSTSTTAPTRVLYVLTNVKIKKRYKGDEAIPVRYASVYVSHIQRVLKVFSVKLPTMVGLSGVDSDTKHSTLVLYFYAIYRPNANSTTPLPPDPLGQMQQNAKTMDNFEDCIVYLLTELLKLKQLDPRTLHIAVSEEMIAGEDSMFYSPAIHTLVERVLDDTTTDTTTVDHATPSVSIDKIKP